jgi:quinol monooxygenase YgiN
VPGAWVAADTSRAKRVYKAQQPFTAKEPTVPVAALLEFRFKSDVVDQVPDAMSRTLAVTRKFDGCQRIDVLVDPKDPSRYLLVEVWASMEHDDAYRQFRASPAGASELGPLLAAAPVVMYYSVADI